ncbi:MAG TPA: DNA cytosine methyltransferase [Desulfotomaculum sp.]|nr:DNA cytosine methyltransferase [Desulfotomaculum sp.]
MYSVVDLFAGAGGLSYGFQQTGRFVVKTAFENNANAQATYRKNHQGTEIYSDVCNADYPALAEKFGQIDVVIGGPPCQGFSNANRQKNHTICQNNTLVKQFVRAVVELNPNAFVMENVCMLRSDIHRFYIDRSDKSTVESYNIPTEAAEILLLEREYVSADVQAIVENYALVQKYIWPESDYLTLNIIYRMRNNEEKRRASLKKHKNKLLRLSARLLDEKTENDYITAQNNRAANALTRYFDGESENIDIISEITQAIMIQRMLGKAQELYENNIVIDHFSADENLLAHVTAMTVLQYIEHILASEAHGYAIDKGVLRAVEFGVPQKRERFVIIGVKKEISNNIQLPHGYLKAEKYATVKDAIEDIENVPVGYDVNKDAGVKLAEVPAIISKLGKQLRNAAILFNHVATSSTNVALDRFNALSQGENFHHLDSALKTTYSNAERTQKTIYLRLKYDEPSGTVINVRKSMWIHPLYNRALSIREAARLQTFPDSFLFLGTKDSQYQQIGNAVPPMLAKAIAIRVAEILDLQYKQYAEQGRNKWADIQNR